MTIGRRVGPIVVLLLANAAATGGGQSGTATRPGRDPIATTGGIALAPGPWRTLRAGFVDIHYLADRRPDALLYAELFDASHRLLRAEFRGVDVDVLAETPVRCGVWLHAARTRLIGAGTSLAATDDGAAGYCEFHFLTPSAYRAEDRCCTKVGERRTVDQLHRIAAHEYATMLLARVTTRRTGWGFYDAPQWFRQGAEEYLGCLATAHTRTVTLAKYRELVARDPDRLGAADVDNAYIDGAVLVQFLYSQFGRKAMTALLMNEAATFDAAFVATFGISQAEFFRHARTMVRPAV